MKLIIWLKKEKIRRRARKAIRLARSRAPDTRQGRRALARRIEKIRGRMNREIAAICRG